MAVLVLCAIHYPTRIIYLFFFLPVPIWLFVLFEIAQDGFGFLTGHTQGTAVSVHLAGAAFAFVYYQRHLRLMTVWLVKVPVSTIPLPTLPEMVLR